MQELLCRSDHKTAWLSQRRYYLAGGRYPRKLCTARRSTRTAQVRVQVLVLPKCSLALTTAGKLKGIKKPGGKGGGMITNCNYSGDMFLRNTFDDGGTANGFNL